ncbi:Hypothetical predicted protein [Pelobates cultripes]|uniref:Uncharacterized protein n=1 Tax=Pelobates cultripes TaxID=61616 RepID=A0AAD1RDF8_PELCU|nr:Hypothetical predicted protein [Pelobates cultripes]
MRAAEHEGAEDMAPSPPPTTPDDSQFIDCLTRSHFEQAMDAMATKLIFTWQATDDQIKKEVRDLSSRTSAVEKHYQELASAQTTVSEHLQALQNGKYGNAHNKPRRQGTQE